MTELYLDNRFCVLNSDMFRPKIGHSQTYNSSKKTHHREEYLKLIWLHEDK
jgi:hypothetical protein